MGRRRTKKFIPDGDSDFACTGRVFARSIEREPERFMLTREDGQRIAHAMDEFRRALTVTTAPGGCTKMDTMCKDELRAKAKAIAANTGTSSARIRRSATSTMVLRIKQRPQASEGSDVPADAAGADVQRHHGGRQRGAEEARAEVPGPDRLRHGGSRRARRGWSCSSSWWRRTSRCRGTRASWGGRGTRPFSPSPMVVEFPVPTTPMKVVYRALGRRDRRDGAVLEDV